MIGDSYKGPVQKGWVESGQVGCAYRVIGLFQLWIHGGHTDNPNYHILVKHHGDVITLGRGKGNLIACNVAAYALGINMEAFAPGGTL